MNHGVRSFVVPGMIPSGCAPPVLAMFAHADPSKYNSTTGCLEDYNKLGMHHNLLLQEALEKLRKRHPDATIIYADLFGPIMEMVESPSKFGKHHSRNVEELYPAFLISYGHLRRHGG